MKEAACRSCGAPIVWTVTMNGKRMPVDLDPVGDVPGAMLFRVEEDPSNGDLIATFIKSDQRYREEELYVSHFATCPQADQHRRTR